MRYYLAFDDTDVKGSKRGTGRFAREFAPLLPHEYRLHGIVRQQYPQSESIPFTSNNSSATLILDHPETGMEQDMIDRAVEYIGRNFVEGSDPGLCVCAESNPALEKLAAFGITCCGRVVTKGQAYAAAAEAHLSEHGGTGDGVIGAAAGVGLTWRGWSGRFVELGTYNLRNFPADPTVAMLAEAGITTVSVTRRDMPPLPDDIVETWEWVRPRLWAGQPVLPVTPAGANRWTALGISDKRLLAI